MALKTEKVIKNAEKYVAKGKLEAAIKEYRKVLAHNPNDINTLNRVGDLYARLERYDEAVKLFTQIAEKYTRDGFFLKAIAIYKKIIKLDPTALAVYERLAELYHRQGLLNEARTQYQVLADYYQKHENATSAITIYQRMSEIEPSNPSFHLKLAELFASQRLTDKALKEYQSLVEVMLAAGSAEETAAVYSKAMELAPDNLGFIRLAVTTLHEGGHVGVAVKVLARATELNPDATQVAAEVGLGPKEPEPEPEPAVVPEPVVEAPAPQISGSDAWSTEPDFAAQPGYDPSVEDGVIEIELDDDLTGGTVAVQPDFGTPDGAADFQVEPEFGGDVGFASGPDDTSHTGLYAEPESDFGGGEEAFTLDLDDDEVPDTQVLPPDDVGAPASAAAETGAGFEEFEFEVDLEASAGDLPLDQVAVEPIDESEIVGPEFTQMATSEPTVAEPESVEIEWSMDGMDDLEVPTLEVETAEPTAEEEAPEWQPPVDLTPAVEPAFEAAPLPAPVVEPLPTEPMPVASVELEPASIEPIPTEVVPTESVPAESVPTEPFQAEPAPPVFVEPMPAVELAAPDVTDIEVSFDLGDETMPSIVAQAEPVAPAAPAPAPAVPQVPAPASAPPAVSAAPPALAAPPPVADAPPAVRRHEDLVAEAKVFAKYGLREKALDRLEELLGQDESHPGGLALRARLDLEAGESESAVDFANQVASHAQQTGEQEEWDELRAEFEAAGYSVVDGRLSKEAPEPKAPGQDDRIAQLLEDLSLESFESAPAAAPSSSPVDSLLTEALGAGTGPVAPAQPPGPPPATAPAESSVESSASSSQLFSLADELSLDDDEDETAVGAAPIVTAPSGAAAMDETGMSWLDEPTPSPETAAAVPASDTIFDEEDDFFDLAAELEEELGGDAIADVSITSVEPQEQSLEEIIEGFKQGVAENLSPEDYDTHFNLGIAYREMGLLDEAIGEFQLASKDPRYLVDGASMLGVCFYEKGLTDLAVRWYRKGLASPDISEDATLGLLYDLGTVFESVGDEEKAYKTFLEIYGMNTNFRDVSNKIQELAPQQT